MINFGLKLVDLLKTPLSSALRKNLDGLVGSSIPEPESLYGEHDSGFTDDLSVPITIDKTVRTKYKSGWINKVRKTPITEVVIHGTAGGETVAGLLNWMYQYGRQVEYYKGIALFHYLIGRGLKGEKDGLIVEVIDPEYFVYHSSSSSNDKSTIGIELLNTSKSNRNPYTDGQYESLFCLIFDHLMNLYPISRITSHRYNIWRWNPKSIAQKYDKDCPGNFDWERLDDELLERGYAFKKDGNLRYDIEKKKKISGLKSDV